jgi:hypothetical protein
VLGPAAARSSRLQASTRPAIQGCCAAAAGVAVLRPTSHPRPIMAGAGVVDCVVCVLYLVVTAMVGARASSRRSRNTEDYLMAGRSMGFCTVGLSVYAALFSGITMLGSPGYVYNCESSTIQASLQC